MTIFDFMGAHPVLTVILAFMVLGAIETVTTVWRK
jgi:hypothetical protein